MTAAVLDPVPCLRGLDPAAVDQSDPRGTVYLVHLDTGLVFPKGGRIRLATPADDPRKVLILRHYLGWTGQGHLEQRMISHRTGASGARFLRIARRQGVTWHLARTWPGDRAEESRIKRMGGASRSCPSCGIIPQAEALRDGHGRFARKEDLMITIHGSTVRRGPEVVARLSWSGAGLALVTVWSPDSRLVLGRLVRGGHDYAAMSAAHQAASTPSDCILAAGVTDVAAIEAVLDHVRHEQEG